MKNELRILMLFLFGFLFTTMVYGQCTPADSTSCPDPENNGEVCPDSLNVGYLLHQYNQTISILPPPQLDTGGLTIPIHHLKLIDVGNLPPGITWVSNTDDSVFMAGNYYCVLFSGTPTDTGSYVLKIIVDVYASFGGSYFYLSRVIDSTSLTMHIEKSSGTNNLADGKGDISFYPNPFSKDFRLKFYSSGHGYAAMKIYTLQGIEVMQKDFYSSTGENIIFIDGSKLPCGNYVVKITGVNGIFTGIITKTE